MPKYMIQASYTADGTKGVMKEGGTKRRATVEANVKAAGGTVEAFYFAFGEADAFVIVDLPDNASAAALSMAVNASGVVALKTHVLLTPQEVDQATKRSVSTAGLERDRLSGDRLLAVVPTERRGSIVRYRLPSPSAGEGLGVRGRLL